MRFATCVSSLAALLDAHMMTHTPADVRVRCVCTGHSSSSSHLSRQLSAVFHRIQAAADARGGAARHGAQARCTRDLRSVSRGGWKRIPLAERTERAAAEVIGRGGEVLTRICSDSGAKVRLSETIVAATRAMGCPHALQAHQIQGSDWNNVQVGAVCVSPRIACGITS